MEKPKKGQQLEKFNFQRAYLHLDAKDNLHVQLIQVKTDPRFYMTSYLVYLLAAQATFLGLKTKGSLTDPKVRVYNHYPQLAECSRPQSGE